LQINTSIAMTTHVRFFFFVLLCSIGLSSGLLAQQKVYVLELRDEIHAASARYISRGVEEAQAQDAALLIIHLDTYGGRIDFADSIRGDILRAGMPTAVFINRNAGSAGAVISIACDSIYMAPGANIGAATVVEGGTTQAAPDKYQSYWRGVMRSTAELKGRDPRIAEKMVDQNLDLPGISPVGQVITFSTQEAIEYGYCDGQKRSVREVAEVFGLEDAQIVTYEGGGVDKLINFLIRPSIASILMILIFGGIFLELKTPGFGLGGAIAIAAVALFFAPHYIEGLAEVWEIALFAVGVLLIALEIFIIPGFGVAGISGIVFAVLGVGAALIANNGTSFEYVSIGDVLQSVALVLVMLTTAILLVIWAARHIATSRASYPFVDHAVQDKAEGYTSFDATRLDLVGKQGEALSDLRPAGHIMIEGKQFDAESDDGYISKGQQIIIDRIRNMNLVVKKA
jgi:membrane-bound serine protease (ClpP class)